MLALGSVATFALLFNSPACLPSWPLARILQASTRKLLDASRGVSVLMPVLDLLNHRHACPHAIEAVNTRWARCVEIYIWWSQLRQTDGPTLRRHASHPQPVSSLWYISHSPALYAGSEAKRFRECGAWHTHSPG